MDMQEFDEEQVWFLPRIISCTTRQKLGNLPSQAGNIFGKKNKKLHDKVAQLCCSTLLHI